MIMGISAQIRINLGFTPVPITSQTLVVLITGALLGSKRGAAVMLLYLLEGAIFPVFSNGSSGLFWQLSTGGYLLGFIPAAFIIGYLVDSNEHRAANTSEVVKLEGLVTFADPITVTSETTSLSMTFNVGEGMHLSKTGADSLWIGSGPFQAIMKAN